MLPLKISSPFDRTPPSQTTLAPARTRAVRPETPPAAAVEKLAPERERRVQPDRRMQNRRAKEQAILLNTRVSAGRRRSPGRRAEDQQGQVLDQTISIRA